MSRARTPDFFIVGAPKCGTTALYSYLRQHPQVFMPRRKEPHYLCPDLYSPKYIRDEREYLALFEGASDSQLLGEASVFYLYSEVAAERIKALSPHAKTIIMLRDPVQMIYSLHSQRLFSGHEDISDFALALAAEADRREGKRLPRHGYPAAVHQYRAVGRYASQVRRYVDTFGKDRVHIILQEDLKRDAAAVHAGICRFLGIDPEHRPTFDVINPNTRVRSRLLRNAIKFSPVVKRVARAALPPGLRQRLARRLVAWNTQVEPRPPLPAGLAQQLRAEYRDDVAELARLIDRDLTAWMV